MLQRWIRTAGSRVGELGYDDTNDLAGDGQFLKMSN